MERTTMRELELDGIHDDGEHVILVDSDGDRFTLRVDEALRAAVRRDRPALGMIQADESAPLRPREIQTLLRSGRSAEDIADVANVPLDHVRRYEGPILAEREFTAQRARTFPVTRGGPSLATEVAERLAARQAEADTAWDAWRRSDGTWTLELSFSAGGRTRQAHWLTDLEARTLVPLDDEAHWISDEDAPLEPARGRGRLKAVKRSVFDQEAEPAPHRSVSARTGRTPIDEEQLDALNARRGLRSVPQHASADSFDEDAPDEASVWSSLDADSVGESAGPAAIPGGAGSGPVASADEALPDADQEALQEHSLAHEDAPGAGSEPEDAEPEAADATWSVVDEPGPEAAADTTAEATIHYQDTVDLTPLPGFDDDSAAGAPSEEENSAAKPVASRKHGKSKRASMPSWDEIVFGSRND
jgi:hypothetical protein